MSLNAAVNTAELLPLAAFQKTHKIKVHTLRGYCRRAESDLLYLRNIRVAGRFMVTPEWFDDWLARKEEDRKAKLIARKQDRGTE